MTVYFKLYQCVMELIILCSQLMVGVITVVVCVVVAGTIKFLGKRKLCIGAMLGTAVFTLALSIYAKVCCFIVMLCYINIYSVRCTLI